MKRTTTIIIALFAAMISTETAVAQSTVSDEMAALVKEQLSAHPGYSVFFPTGRFKPDSKSGLDAESTISVGGFSLYGEARKAVTDNGIGERLSQEADEEGEWQDYSKAFYAYSSDRSTIMQTLYTFTEGSWVESGYSELVYNSNGFPVSVEVQEDNEFFGELEINQYFYYAPSGRIDSLILETNLLGENGRQKVIFTYVTADSIVLSYEGVAPDEEYEAAYFVQKDGNLIELYQEEGYTDRYVYYDITLSELLQRQFDEFFVVEVYNDELYDPEDGFIPYSRTTLKKENEVVVESLEEWYDEFSEEWNAIYRNRYIYEEGRIVEIVVDYISGEDTFPSYRDIFQYQNAVANEEEPGSVRNFTLHQNYPNPFNPGTTISFELEQPQFITLKVYDVLGKEVASLVSGYKNAGEHSVRFDASALPSGRYFYRVRGKGFAETRTMTLIK